MNKMGREMKAYILCNYDDDGPNKIQVCLDKEEAWRTGQKRLTDWMEAVVSSRKSTIDKLRPESPRWSEIKERAELEIDETQRDYVLALDKLTKILDADMVAPDTSHDLQTGWGGIQIHIVDVTEGTTDVTP